MSDRFKMTSDAVSDLYVRYLLLSDELLAKAPDRRWSGEGLHYVSDSANAEAWTWFEREKAKVVKTHGWTPEEYEAAEMADQAAFCGALFQIPDWTPINVIHMDGIEPEPEIDQD